MKKFIIIFISLFISSVANANELENTLNKVYGKGSEVVEDYITNLLDGPGSTEVSIGTKRNKERDFDEPTGSIMIVRPYNSDSINNNSVIFYQAQINSYEVNNSIRQSINYGIGKRFLSDDKSHFWGINTFFDADTERVLEGYDINIAGQVPYVPWANINYNNYTWLAQKASQNSEGEMYSGTFNLSNDYTLEVGVDDNNFMSTRTFAKLIYIHGAKKRPNMNDGFTSTEAFQDSDVSKEMLTKVKRSNIITLEIEGTGVVIANGN